MKQIIIDITSTGEVTIDKVGFKGKECEKESFIEEALGTTKSSKKKPEYYKAVTATQKVGGG